MTDSIVSLIIEGRQVDLNENNNIPITYNINDIKNISSRSSNYSKTINLPGTANNHRIFGNLFDIKSNSITQSGSLNVGYNYNPQKKALAYLFQDNQVVLKGYIQLNKINNQKGLITYDVTFNSELNNLITTLGEKLVENLDLSHLNHNNSLYFMTSSWYANPYTASRNSVYSATADDNKVLYPVIDYGVNDSKAICFTTENMKPAIYVKHYWDQIFEEAGFEYSSSFIDSYFFKKLVIPFAEENLLTNSGSLLVKAGLSGSYVIRGVYNESDNAGYEAAFGTETIDPNGYYNTTTKEFTAPSSSTYLITPNIHFTETHQVTIAPTGSLSFTNNGYLGFEFIISSSEGYKRNIGANTYNVKGNLDANSNPYTRQISLTEPYSIWLEGGERVKVMGRVFSTLSQTQLYSIDNPGVIPDIIVPGSASLAISGSSTFSVFRQSFNNIDLTYRDFVIKNIKQKDFITSILKIFNLLAIPDRDNPKKLIIVQRDDFYRNYRQIVDWTYKVDNNSDISIEQIPELDSKNFLFSWKEDSDYFNTLYKNKYNEVYGQKLVTSSYEFSTETKKVMEGIIFSPTPLVLYSNESQGGEGYVVRSGVEILELGSVTENSSPTKLSKAYPGVGITFYGFDGWISSGSIYSVVEPYNFLYRLPDADPGTDKTGSFVYTYNNDKIIPAIYKSEDNNLTRKPTKSNPRLLFYGDILSCNNWLITLSQTLTTIGNSQYYEPDVTMPISGFTAGGNCVVLDEYPFVGSISDPFQPLIDLNFGTPRETYFPASETFFQNNLNNFWNYTIEDIVDKDAKLVTTNIKLNSVDVSNLDFSDIIHIDGTYFRLNKIIDYSPNNKLTQVELFKFPFSITRNINSVQVPSAPSGSTFATIFIHNDGVNGSNTIENVTVDGEPVSVISSFPVITGSFKIGSTNNGGVNKTVSVYVSASNNTLQITGSDGSTNLFVNVTTGKLDFTNVLIDAFTPSHIRLRSGSISGQPSQIFWSFTTSGSVSSSMAIRENGTLRAYATTNTSSMFLANSGSTITSVVSGSTAIDNFTASLSEFNRTANILFFNSSSINVNIGHNFTTTANSNYGITGSISSPIPGEEVMINVCGGQTSGNSAGGNVYTSLGELVTTDILISLIISDDFGGVNNTSATITAGNNTTSWSSIITNGSLVTNVEIVSITPSSGPGQTYTNGGWIGTSCP